MKQVYSIFFALLLIFTAGSSFAQNPAQHHVSIKKGTVSIDGKKVEANHLPKSLQDMDMTASLQFWGTNETLFEISGTLYSVSSGTLIERDRDALTKGNLSVYFSSERNDFPVRVFETKPVEGTYVLRSADRSKPMENYVAVLNERAEEFNNLRFKIDSIQEPHTAQLATELKLGAENMVRIAESFPKVQFEAYLHEIQDADHALYNTLLREQQMEMETHRLAMKIREASNRSDQERIAKELRAQLNAIFSLKQNNRKMEIEQLSQKLTELQSRLKERETLRDEIVENRVRELLDQYRW